MNGKCLARIIGIFVSGVVTGYILAKKSADCMFSKDCKCCDSDDECMYVDKTNCSHTDCVYHDDGSCLCTDEHMPCDEQKESDIHKTNNADQ